MQKSRIDLKSILQGILNSFCLYFERLKLNLHSKTKINDETRIVFQNFPIENLRREYENELIALSSTFN